MSFFQRAVSFTAMALGLAASIGASTPGFAKQVEQPTNVTVTASVPSTGEFTGLPQPIPADLPVVSPSISDDPGEEAESYVSLSQAVAAQDAPGLIGDDLSCLAGAIYFEAKGEPLAGQLAVAEVILNRAKSGRFAPSVCAVVTQARQFSFVRGGHIPAIGDNANYRTALAVAQVALGDHWDSPAPAALYFHARRVSPGWRMQKVAAIGNHIFYR